LELLFASPADDTNCDVDHNNGNCSPAGTELQVGGSAGFDRLLPGYRYIDGSFVGQGSYAYFWSSSASGVDSWGRFLRPDDLVYRNAYDRTDGFAIRCLKN
jgi:uncharacterized protein (TIGR02145 family)